jgi:F0F1-type ATP synthase delta subunit
MEYLTPEIKNNLSLFLKTKKTALKTLETLETIESGLFEEGIGGAEFYENFTQRLELSQKEVVTFLINDVLDGKYDKVDIDHIAEEFSNYIKDVEVLHVTLPIEPSDKLLEDIYEWLKKNFVKDEIFLLEHEVEEDMFAGLKVSYKGKFHDLSLDTEIEAFLDSYQFIQ